MKLEYSKHENKDFDCIYLHSTIAWISTAKTFLISDLDDHPLLTALIKIDYAEVTHSMSCLIIITSLVLL